MSALDKVVRNKTLVRGRAGGNFSLARPQKLVARGVGLSDLIIPEIYQSFKGQIEAVKIPFIMKLSGKM